MQTLHLGHHEQSQELSTRGIGFPTCTRFDLAVIIIAAINVTAALAMISYILFDARILARSLQVQRVFHIHPAEVFPLIISIAIIVQGTISIYVQSITFSLHLIKSLSPLNLQAIGQLAWSASWIVPYTMLVFGLETTFRSLHRKRFIHRKWWAVLLCVITVLIMILVTWLHSRLDSTVGWTGLFANVGLIIGSCVLFTYIVCATAITTQLIRTTSMDTSQRISATRVVYYLIVSSLIMALVIPFFAQRYLHKESDQLGRIAEVALNSLGIINLLLPIFLRSNAARAAIRPWKSMSSKKRPLRVFGPSDLEMTMHITSPVLLEEKAERLWENGDHQLVGRPRGTSHSANNPDRLDKEAGHIRQNSHHNVSFDRSRRPPQDENDHPQIIVQPSPFPQRKNSNYSIFPTFRSAMLRNSSSTTFSQGSEAQSLQPPKPVVAQSSNHKRDGSQQTSATVEIGFRLSAFSDERSPSTRSSSINSSLRRPLFGKTQSRGASPPISPLSARRPHVASMISTSGDSATLPRNMMSPRSLQNERLRRSILGYLSPGRRSQSSLRREQLRRLTMKALPPDPPREVRLKPPGF